MAAVGVPTTRALAAVTTRSAWYARWPSRGHPDRVARSHIRVGTFQFAAVRRDEAVLKALADHVIARHYPKRPMLTIRTLPCWKPLPPARRHWWRWMSLGFIHGVMNTDNCSIAGDTIDYGPCAFMEQFDPQKVFSSIDQGGRYAFNHQPGVAQWNLARFAETLLPLMRAEGDAAVEQATEVLRGFTARFGAEQRRLHAKAGPCPGKRPCRGADGSARDPDASRPHGHDRDVRRVDAYAKRWVPKP